MVQKIAILLFCLLYDCAVAACFIPAWLFSFFIPSLRKYFKTRSSVFTLRKAISVAGNTEAVFFYCSSIGELEQAMPVIASMEEHDKTCFIFFHSHNGYNHAKALGFKNITITPIDLFCTWAIVFAGKRPSMCIIDRHEYWPGFVFAALLYSKLYVINAVQKKEPGFIERSWWRWVHRNSAAVFFVNSPANAGKNIIRSGDTRTDRLKHRAASEQNEIEALKNEVRNNADKVLVIGNAYNDDATMLRRTLDLYPAVTAGWTILIIPSRPQMGVAISETIGDQLSDSNTRVITVMGKLFQYYGCADVAWVGGGFCTAGIHNTLEPFHFGIPIISGPNLDEQPDALMLKERQALRVFNEPDELLALLNSITSHKQNDTKQMQYSPTQFITKHILAA